MKRVLRLSAALIASLGFAMAHAHGPALNADAGVAARAPVARSDSLARELTTRLDAMRASHARLKLATDKAAALPRLVDLARQRHDALAELVEADPAEVLRVALPPAIRASLPAEAQAYVEESAEESGEVEVLHVDHVDTSEDYYLYFLDTPRGRFSLHFAGDAPDLSTGAQARVRGVRVGKAIVVAGSADVLADKAAAVPNTRGAQKTLAILVNFSNAPTQPFTPAYAQNVIFGDTSAFDYELSYQQTTLTGAVAGWFTIAATSTTCDYGAIATQAKAAATNAGYALSNYSRLVYVFPSNSCTWWGLGSVGGTPSQAWIHTKWGLSYRIVGHEMGHNFGLFHAHSLDCGSASVAASGCTSSEYGDVFDLMGSSSTGGHFNAFHKERLGWLADGVSPPITTVAAVTGTASYDIAPLERARDTAPRALKIPRATACGANNEWFYVESRKAVGYDAGMGGSTNVVSGVVVRKVTEGAADSSYLLDMTAGTTAWSDAALVAGQSFTDPVSGLTIATVAADANGARVSVTYPAASCTRAAPLVTVTPGGTVWTAAGQSVGYTVQTQNRDSCGCAASNFDVTAAVPGGWAATNARTPSVAPGATASSSILVTTPAGAAAGFYAVTLATTNVVAPSMTASAASTVSIEAATTTPTTPVSSIGAVVKTDKASYKYPRRGTATAKITTTVTSGGKALAGAAVSVDVRNPAGGVATLKGTTSSNGTVTLSYAITSSGGRGTYAVTSNATKDAASATATASFAVN